MEISSISFSKPYIEYNSIVYHFSSRKSAAIEWLILELINRYSNEYSSISIKTILEDMLFIPDTDSLVLPSLIELINLRAVESDFYINRKYIFKQYFSISNKAYRFRKRTSDQKD
ncbi:hypothetical protein OGZ02_00085 [Brachyspira hyodysenteriae]|nr:hypothetical protein [Brachyspira hyodysenteriae]MDA1467276.1 hypothetical protein [Brachyspira hyodysenteriae]